MFTYAFEDKLHAYEVEHFRVIKLNASIDLKITYILILKNTLKFYVVHKTYSFFKYVTVQIMAS